MLHEHTGDAELLNRAVSHAKTAVAIRPASATAGGLANLATLLAARADQASESSGRGIGDSPTHQK